MSLFSHQLEGEMDLFHTLRSTNFFSRTSDPRLPPLCILVNDGAQSMLCNAAISSHSLRGGEGEGGGDPF